MRLHVSARAHEACVCRSVHVPVYVCVWCVRAWGIAVQGDGIGKDTWREKRSTAKTALLASQSDSTGANDNIIFTRLFGVSQSQELVASKVHQP